jgi:hypothetical protein
MTEKRKKPPQDESLFKREGENYFNDQGEPLPTTDLTEEGISVNAKERAEHLVNSLGHLAAVRRNTGLGKGIELPARSQAIKSGYAKRQVKAEVVEGKIVPSALKKRKDILEEAEDEFRQAFGHVEDEEEFEEFWKSFRARFAGGKKEARARDAYRKNLQKFIES